MPTSNAKDTIGSWFPSGYYGHDRNKTRTDFVCEYRQLAKPQPPGRFVARALSRDTRHPFSLHDNRNVFSSEAVYFEQALGKRRCPARSGRFDPEFYTWMPLRQQLARSLPNLSSYQTDYTSVRGAVRQLLVTHPPTSCLQSPPDTTYRYHYCAGCPHKAEMRGMARGALQLSTTARQRSAIRNPTQPRETVASCLSWYRSSRPLPAVAPPASTNDNGGADLALPQVPGPPGPQTEKAAEGGCVCPPLSSGPPQPVGSQAAKPEAQSVPPPPLQPTSSQTKGGCGVKCEALAV